MNRVYVLIPRALALVAAWTLAACGTPAPESPESRTRLASEVPNPAPQQSVKRIVSLAPSLTETLFALGLGDRVVGVTQYCDYPPEADAIKRIGGFVDPSFEEILALKPDLTVLLTSHRDAQRALALLGIRVLVTPEATLADIAGAIRLIGDACGVPDEADAMLKDLASRGERVRDATVGLARPRVLACIGRDMESGQLSGMYVAGRHGFYNEIIESAGGVNAYRDEAVAYPQISAEGVIQLNPDVIIDLVSMVKPGGRTTDAIVAQWASLRTVNAVCRKRVHVIVGNHAFASRTALHPVPGRNRALAAPGGVRAGNRA